MLRFSASLLLTTLTCSALCVAQTLTLDHALELALDNNTAVTNAQLQREAAEEDVAALRTLRYPRLDLRGGVSRNLEKQRYTFDEGVWGTYPVVGEIPANDIEITSSEGTSRQVAASVTQPLSQQYRIGLSVEQGEVKEDMASEFTRLVQQDIARVVKQNYFDILQTQSTLEATQESIVFYTSLSELVSNYVAQKIAFEYELLETRARLARRQLDANTQLNRLSTQKERMNSLLARDINTPFAVQELPDIILLPEALDDAVETALTQRPDILESQLKIKDATLGYDIKKAEYLPDLDLNVSYIKLYDATLIPDTEAYIGLHAKWEIYDWGRKKSELAAKNNMIQQAANSAQELEKKVAIEVRKSYRAIAEAEEGVEVARLTQAAARDKLRVLANQYKQQSTLLQNVLDAESDLDKANNEYTRSVLSVWKARAELQQAIGEV